MALEYRVTLYTLRTPLWARMIAVLRACCGIGLYGCECQWWCKYKIRMDEQTESLERASLWWGLHLNAFCGQICGGDGDAEGVVGCFFVDVL